MTDPYSPYSVPESQPPKWKPGEELAAAAFVGISLFLVLDINVGIFRVFKKRQGLYYWSMQLGTLACAVDALGVILKYLVPNSRHVWPLYTLLLLGGWSVYAPAQLLVLYSRLHLVNNSYKIQRWVLILIIVVCVACILPTWIVVVPAYDIDPEVSSLWSPRDSIVEHYTQLFLTIIECTVSGVYVWSLLGLLNLKSSVRQRRVMLDLICVNAIIVTFDFTVVILVYLNQLGLSHPIQNFSYALKLKLEFVVLNQLMAVAARGLQRESFEERRYHHPSLQDAFSAECHKWEEKPSGPPPLHHRQGHQQGQEEASGKQLSTECAEISVPSPVLSRMQPGSDERTNTVNRNSHMSLDRYDFGAEPALDLHDFMDEHSSHEDDGEWTCTHPSKASSGEMLQPSEKMEGKPHLYTRRIREAKNQALRSMRHPLGRGQRQGSRGSQRLPVTAKIRMRRPKNGRDSNEDDEEEEEMGVHMWENRGQLVMEVPWFKSKVEP